jgi:hypothetical protein
MPYTVDVFIVNDTADLPFLLAICHFCHLWRYSRARFAAQSTLASAGTA